MIRSCPLPHDHTDMSKGLGELIVFCPERHPGGTVIFEMPCTRALHDTSAAVEYDFTPKKGHFICCPKR